jgi:hypothetical protein
VHFGRETPCIPPRNQGLRAGLSETLLESALWDAVDPADELPLPRTSSFTGPDPVCSGYLSSLRRPVVGHYWPPPFPPGARSATAMLARLERPVTHRKPRHHTESLTGARFEETT